MEGIRLFADGQYFLRAMKPQDAALRLDFFVRNRAALEPFMPTIPAADYTLARQRQILIKGYQDMQEDRRYLFGIFSAQVGQGGMLLGYVNLNNVIRGAFHSCDIGYGVDRNRTGQGIMTASVREVCDLAFSVLHLHRIQAAIMPSNKASLRVVEKAGFERIGLSRRYLKIHGFYQDHVLLAKVTADTE